MRRLIEMGVLLLFTACSDKYYSIDDFSKVKKIDAHIHLRTEEPDLIDIAIKYNFKLITINTESTNPSSQEVIALSLAKKYPELIYYLGYFPTDSINNNGWADSTISVIKKNIRNGTLGIKIWKNIGMEIKNRDGKYIMADNPVFDKVFSYMTSEKIPLMSHLGEPKYCWQPLGKMVFGRNYYKKNPQYHMYNHPECPNYTMQIEAMERLLEKNPDLIYIGAHLASLEWSVDELANRLDRFPNMCVDVSARIECLQLQTRDNREKVRDFFIRYSDRIIYGSDFVVNEGMDDSFYKYCNDTWLSDWEFFVSDNRMENPDIKGFFNGLKLPKDVIDHIYFKNAYKLLLKKN